MKRVKRRYLALKIDSDEALSSKDFIDAVWGTVSKLYGEYGASQTGLALIDYDDEKQLAIIRVSHAALKMVRASLATITRIGDKPVSIHVLTVSGTIKALYTKLETLT